MSEVEVYVLDVGQEKYGDSILIRGEGKVILVDGGNASSCRDQNGYKSVPSQIRTILGLSEAECIHVNLLVVTHCHADHIGCLPSLVCTGKLTADHALVADERLGFGLDEHDQPPSSFQSANSILQNVLYALLEEAPTPEEVADDHHLETFISGAGGLKKQYMAMLTTLRDQGTTVVRYGRDEVQGVMQHYSGLPLKIIGPTVEHLNTCGAYIRTSLEQLTSTHEQASLRENSEIELYRQLHGAAHKLHGTNSASIASACRNNQSILLTCGPNEQRVFLAGDMQFHEVETPALQASMDALWQTVLSLAPFSMVKTAHHTAGNGLRLKHLQDLLRPGGIAVHSGGRNAPLHPNPSVLHELEHAQDAPAIDFYRTDRNGQVRVTCGQVTTHGQKNDYSPNVVPKKRPTH